MAPLAGEEIIQWSAAMGAASVPDRVDFCLMHSHAFGDWVPFDLQLLETAVSESKLTFA